jgi:hypothetical protein
LHQHLALLRRGARYVHHHVGVGILEQYALGYGSGLLGDAQAPLDLLRRGVLLPKLQNAVAICVEIAVRALAFGDEEGVGVIGSGAAFNPKELSVLPIAVGELDLFSEVLDDQRRQRMHDLKGISLVDVLDHPHLIQVFVVGSTHAWDFVRVVL